MNINSVNVELGHAQVILQAAQERIGELEMKLAQLQEEVIDLRRLNEGLCERIYAQSQLLARRAEKV